MSWETVNSAGKTIVIKNIPKGPASIAAPRFLDEFHNTYIKQCTKYFKVTNDIPFNYSELRLHSVMIPALDQICDAVFAEQPINKDGRSGRTDYLVLSGNQVYLIELKHSWLSYNSRKITKATTGKWNNAIKDLNDVTWDDAFSLFPAIKTVSKIALMVVPLYDHSKSSDKLEDKSYDRDTILKKFQSFSAQLNPKPNWIGIWALKENIDEVRPIKGGSFERYPAVALVAHIQGQTR